MKKIQSIPYPTYTTAERDALVDVLLNTKINNSDTGKVEEYDGSAWIEQGGGGHTIKNATTTLAQRAGLKFTGNVAVTDDSVGNNTVVEILGQNIIVDSVPTDGSANPVSSNGVFDALANKVDKNAAITGATHTKVTYDAKGLVTGGSDLIASDIPNIAENQVINLTTNLGAKADKVTITGATKTKITYNSQGIVTGGADATTADIADSTDKRYVTDAKLTVLNNTSGTNTGDQTGANLPITTPLGYTSNNQQGLDNEFATKIIGIETQISANQLTFASIYGYYNFI